MLVVRAYFASHFFRSLCIEWNRNDFVISKRNFLSVYISNTLHKFSDLLDVVAVAFVVVSSLSM